MSKKGQSISINTIIIAAIGLAVLVVIFVVFTGRFKIFSEGVAKTASCENTCKSLGKYYYTLTEQSCKDPSVDFAYVPGEYNDVPKGLVCCCKLTP